MASSYHILGKPRPKGSGATGNVTVIACSPRAYAEAKKAKALALSGVTIDLLRSMHAGNVVGDKACLGMIPTRRDEWKIPPRNIMQQTEKAPTAQQGPAANETCALVIWTRHGETSAKIVENLALLLSTPSGATASFIVISEADGHSALHNQLRVCSTPAVILNDSISHGLVQRHAMKRLGKNQFVCIMHAGVRVKPNWLGFCVATMRDNGLDLLSLARATREWASGSWAQASKSWPKTEITNGALWHTDVSGGVLVYARGLILQGQNGVPNSSAYWDGDVASLNV